MKKRTALLFLSFALACVVPANRSSSCAQAQSLGEAQVGAKAGASYSRLRFELDETNRQLGAVAGLMARFPLSSALFLQPEVLYVQKGGERELSGSVNGETITVEENYALDYLEVPLTAHLRLPIENLWPTVFAGPYASLVLSDRYDVTPEQVDDQPLEGEIDYEGLDYGFVFGASLDVPVGGRTMVLDIRYDLGFRDLDSTGTFGDITDEVDRSAQNDAFLFTVGLLF